MFPHPPFFHFFFFNDTATTEIYTLSLHDALPISCRRAESALRRRAAMAVLLSGVHRRPVGGGGRARPARSEEHTSKLQSPCNLVCRLLLEKKKKQTKTLAAGSRVHYRLLC